MTGWPLAWKCFVACLFLEESQQPTWPQVKQRRRCTHRSPVARHSSQPSELGVTGRICLTCGQVGWAIAVLLLAEVVARFRAAGKDSSLALRDTSPKRKRGRHLPSLALRDTSPKRKRGKHRPSLALRACVVLSASS